MVIKSCVICGRKFDARSPRAKAKTCGPACSHQNEINYSRNYVLTPEQIAKHKHAYDERYRAGSAARLQEKMANLLAAMSGANEDNIKLCRRCGKPVVGRGRLAKYCSIECGKSYRRENREAKRQRTCICGVVFSPKYGPEKSCSPECARERAKAYFTDEIHKKESRICARERYIEARRQAGKPYRAQGRACAQCGKSFPAIGTRKTCSEECRRKQLRENEHRYYQKHKQRTSINERNKS